MLFAALVHLAVIVASVGLVVSSLAKRAWRRAGTIAVIAATCAVAVHAVDWNQAFIRHQVAWHQDALRELAARYSHGDVEDGSSVPSSLGVLSSDDVVHVWSNDRYDVAGSPVLFIQTWQDWRAENGMGLAYFRLPPDAATWVRTAEGDGGHPVRDLGNGWWWVE
jgi:hypothetical protein